MKPYQKPKQVRDLREQGRVILAHGEATGHAHEVVTSLDTIDVSTAEFFEEPNGRRVLLAMGPCVLRHQEHDPVALDPDRPVQARQGDVLLTPIARGVWDVTRQREYSPGAIHNVAD